MRDPERTRRRLLKVARKQFAAKSFAGARVDEIARSAGINKQALYYHFGSKEELFREALESGYRLFRERDRDLDVDDKPPAEALAKVIGVTFDDLRQAPELIALINDENRQKARHLKPQRVRDINRPLLGTVAKILERGEREGAFRSGNDAVQFYLSMMAMMMFYFSNSYTLSMVVNRKLLSDAAIRARRAYIIDLLLRSLRP
jgi:TetR/AcrR family transcriptional regulator